MPFQQHRCGEGGPAGLLAEPDEHEHDQERHRDLRPARQLLGRRQRSPEAVVDHHDGDVDEDRRQHGQGVPAGCCPPGAELLPPGRQTRPPLAREHHQGGQHRTELGCSPGSRPRRAPRAGSWTSRTDRPGPGSSAADGDVRDGWGWSCRSSWGCDGRCRRSTTLGRRPARSRRSGGHTSAGSPDGEPPRSLTLQTDDRRPRAHYIEATSTTPREAPGAHPRAGLAPAARLGPRTGPRLPRRRPGRPPRWHRGGGAQPRAELGLAVADHAGRRSAGGSADLPGARPGAHPDGSAAARGHPEHGRRRHPGLHGRLVHGGRCRVRGG